MIWRKRRDEINSFWKKTFCSLLCVVAMLLAGCAGKESAEEGISGEQKNIDTSGKVPGWRSAVGLHCKFNRRAV